MNEPERQIMSILGEAVEYRSPQERAAFLDKVCAGDPDRRARLEELLRAYDAAGNFLQRASSSPESQATAAQVFAETAGTVIGPYKLMEQIGEGGFGLVFVAEQQEPVRRKVALKILKPGMDTRQVIARFEAERQALAIMDHPNIAKVFDGGVTGVRGQESGVRNQGSAGVALTPDPCLLTPGAGRPYFVMELVKGKPITQFCDENRSTPRQRLELFVDVCAAVQHAHQKGIIHRDLKPSNVLVTSHDGKPVVKVIDFGVAKAIGGQLTDKTVYTHLAQLIGTPLYMSPEQAGQSGLDIDTRSDIYSLGVLLYELLTGTTPFSKERFKQAAYDEIRRIIREEEPPKPSTRLSDSHDSLPSVAAQRHTEPAKLTKLVRGELDWIVMKALEKDRNRRYETANGFAMDVQRYLADEPVLACPPSAWYRLRKFVRRNKSKVAVAGLVLLFLVILGGVVGYTASERASRQARVTAQVQLTLEEVDRLEKEQKWPEALAAAKRAEAALAGGEADAATRERVRQVVTDLEMISRLEEIRLLESEQNKQAGLDIRSLIRRYTSAFQEYGIDVENLPFDQAAARLQSRPAVGVALALALNDWARLRRHVGEEEMANKLLSLAMVIDADPWRSKLRRIYVAKDRDALVALAKTDETARQPPASLADVAASLRKTHPELAVGILEKACHDHPGDFWIHHELATNLSRCHPPRLEAAVRHYVVARALRPRSQMAWTNLAIALAHQGKLDEAIACYRKAIELDPKDAFTHMRFGRTLAEHKKLDEAIVYYRKAIELDPKYAPTHTNLGIVLANQEKLDEAIACHRKAIELDPKDAIFHSNLGFGLYRQGKFDEAIDCCRKAIELDPKFVPAHNNVGISLLAQKKPEEAIACFQKAIELDPKDAKAHSNLGDARKAQDKLNEAIAYYRKAIELDPKLSHAYRNLGRTLKRKGQVEEAIACFRKAIELDPKDKIAHANLAQALYDQKKLDEAIASLQKVLELDPNAAGAYKYLGLALADKGQIKQARDCFRKAIALDANDANTHRALAWSLATCAEPALRDAALAVKHAENAVQLNPKESACFRTLGVAHYRSGNWVAAVRAFEQSVKVSKTNVLEISGSFFLAMAHWQLGEKEKAQSSFEGASQWMEKHQPNNEELRRFRAEAAALLKMADEKPAKKPESK